MENFIYFLNNILYNYRNLNGLFVFNDIRKQNLVFGTNFSIIILGI